ncbi:MAG TPA: YqaA family protein [Kaistia sp.]|nr:YqaA family protein [Kaistia sp.]
MMELAGLFTAAFLAATLLPAQSEAVLIALLLKGDVAPWLLIATASAGNVLGAIINWLLGRFLEHFRHRRWFPVSETALGRAQRWYHKVGRWSLLLSWLPIVGDPLTVVAGTLRQPLWSFVLLVAIGKVGRYVILAIATLGVAG